MEEQTHKRPRRVMVSNGKLLIMQEVAFKEGEPQHRTNFFSTFDGNAAKVAQIALKKRIEKCLSALTKHIGEATRVTDMVVEWKDGYLSIPAYEAMEKALEILECENLQEMTRYSAIQALKAIKWIRYNDVRTELYPLDKEDFENIVECTFNVFCEIALTANK